MKKLFLISFLLLSSICFAQHIDYFQDSTSTFWKADTFSVSSHSLIISNDSATDTLYITTDTVTGKIQKFNALETIILPYVYVYPSPMIIYIKSFVNPIKYRLWGF